MPGGNVASERIAPNLLQQKRFFIDVNSYRLALLRLIHYLTFSPDLMRLHVHTHLTPKHWLLCHT